MWQPKTKTNKKKKKKKKENGKNGILIHQFFSFLNKSFCQKWNGMECFGLGLVSKKQNNSFRHLQ
jgi:hypothetical protein